MSEIYDFKNKDIKIEFNSIKIGNSAYINQPIEVIEYIEYLQNQLQQKENIIKEVRQYIKYQLENLDFEKDIKAKMLGAMVLVMLDKENKQ